MLGAETRPTPDVSDGWKVQGGVGLTEEGAGDPSASQSWHQWCLWAGTSDELALSRAPVDFIFR